MSIASDMLQAYIEAEADVLLGKEVHWSDGRRLRMEDLPEIRKGRREWQTLVAIENQVSGEKPARAFRVRL